MPFSWAYHDFAYWKQDSFSLSFWTQSRSRRNVQSNPSWSNAPKVNDASSQKVRPREFHERDLVSKKILPTQKKTCQTRKTLFRKVSILIGRDNKDMPNPISLDSKNKKEKKRRKKRNERPIWKPAKGALRPKGTWVENLKRATQILDQIGA